MEKSSQVDALAYNRSPQKQKPPAPRTGPADALRRIAAYGVAPMRMNRRFVTVLKMVTVRVAGVQV